MIGKAVRGWFAGRVAGKRELLMEDGGSMMCLLGMFWLRCMLHQHRSSSTALVAEFPHPFKSMTSLLHRSGGVVSSKLSCF